MQNLPHFVSASPWAWDPVIERLGKVDNGQVAVFASLVQGEKVGILNTRLSLPESWIADQKRCARRDSQCPMRLSHQAGIGVSDGTRSTETGEPV